MRITEVVVRFYPHVGGVEQTVLQIGKHFVANGHTVNVVCAAEPEGPSNVDGISVLRQPYLGKIGGTNLALGLVRAIKRTEPDIIHTHMPTAWFTDAAAVASTSLEVPLVLTYNNDLVGPGLKGLLGRIYNRFLLPRLLRTSKVIVVPNPAYTSHSPHLSSFNDRIVSIPWGVDEDRFFPLPLPNTGPLEVCFLSLLDRHHDYKGLADLLAAISELKKNGIELRLRVGGEGEKLEHYRHLASSLGIESQVEFLGFIKDENLVDFYHSGHLFALPSRSASQEGFGLVLLEAMASGRPVLTTEIVGMARDIQKRQTGFVIPPNDLDALVQSLKDAHDSPDKLGVMSANARKLVLDTYTWNRISLSYLALFQDLLQ